MSKGGDQRAKAAENGKRVGRPAKAVIPQFADRGIASRVLAMDGPPNHARVCDCAVCKGHPKNCECVEEKEDTLKLLCRNCRIAEEHAVCRCEICGWWEVLIARDQRLVLDGRKYLTDRRDGKPAQGVFVGDTRETMQALERGKLPSHFGTGAHAPGLNKPN